YWSNRILSAPANDANEHEWNEKLFTGHCAIPRRRTFICFPTIRVFSSDSRAVGLKMSMLRRIARFLSVPVIWLMMPVKRLAYCCRRSFLGRALLEVTCFGDFLLVLADVQNAVLEIHHCVWGGNFLFGKSVMVVDYEVAAREIA